jgi:hypothetical protein
MRTDESYGALQPSAVMNVAFSDYIFKAARDSYFAMEEAVVRQISCNKCTIEPSEM